MSMIITAKDNDKIKYTKSLLKSKNVKNYIFIDKFMTNYIVLVLYQKIELKNQNL